MRIRFRNDTVLLLLLFGRGREASSSSSVVVVVVPNKRDLLFVMMMMRFLVSLFFSFKAKSLSRFLCEKKSKKKKKLIREISSKDFLRLRCVLFLSLSRKTPVVLSSLSVSKSEKKKKTTKRDEDESRIQKKSSFSNKVEKEFEIGNTIVFFFVLRRGGGRREEEEAWRSAIKEARGVGKWRRGVTWTLGSRR